MRMFNLFRRKTFKPEPKQLRIDGVKTPLTPEPDDAELAAQALLESMSLTPGPSPKGEGSKKKQQLTDVRDAAYYRRLADRIRLAHETARLRAMRFIAFCEQELKKPDLPLTGEGSMAMLEAELYKRIDTIEREGGDLKRRWQHCLAECIMRQMNAVDETDLTELTD